MTMTTNQPVWALVANLGDASPLDYGGYFIFKDETGVYPEEAELLELDDENDENSTYTVYRFPLERCTLSADGVLSDNSCHPEHAAWFADSLASVASYIGDDANELREWFCSADPVERACAYRAVGEYHGWKNLDEYPIKLTRAEAQERYGKGE